MRLNDGRYECINCGARLDVPLMEDPRVTIQASSGEPNRRTLMLDGKEIHSCTILTERERLLNRAVVLRQRSAELRARADDLQTN